MRRSRRMIVVAAVSVVAVFLAARPLPGLAVPGASPSSPGDAETASIAAIEAAESRAETARAELHSLSTRLSLLVEEYHAVEAESARLQARIEDVQDRLETARDEESRAERMFSERAADIYKQGPKASLMALLLETRSFVDLLTRLDFYSRLVHSDSVMLERLVTSRKGVEEARVALENRRREQRVLAHELDERAREIRRSVAVQEAYVASLDAEVAHLIEQERARQRRLEEERARKAAEEAARLAAARERAGTASARTVQERIERSRAATGTGEAWPEVVGFALEHLGVPYVWGGDSPGEGFDCSGLVWYVYRQAGVVLPRNSSSQYTAGAFIPADDLSALVMGDLVFFGHDGDPGRVHHVGIYCGSGDFIHAPNTGDVVKVSSLVERIDSRGDYVGACRF